MASDLAPNSALELFREEFAEALQSAIGARELEENPLPAFIALSDAFEKVAKTELAQWVNIIAELGLRVDDGLGELPHDLAEAVTVTTDALVQTSHLGLAFLADNTRIIAAASTALAWCALAAADADTARYVIHEHPAALTAALEILDDATEFLS